MARNNPEIQGKNKRKGGTSELRPKVIINDVAFSDVQDEQRGDTQSEY